MHTSINQLIPPNCVNYSRKFNFITGNKERNIVTGLLLVKSNIVEVYTIEPLNEKRRLKLFSKHAFASRVESIEVIPRTRSSTLHSDLIFMSFSDCKMSVFEYQPLVNDFIAKSLHFFERESYRTGSIFGTNTSFKPKLIQDPEGRMVAMRVFYSHLALFPLSEDSDLNNLNNIGNDTESLQSSVLNFVDQIDSRLKSVRNLVFLPGFLNPTLAVLYDRGSNTEDESLTLRSSLNHSDISHAKETCAVMIIAIEPLKQNSFQHRLRKFNADSSNSFQFTVVNCIENIPFDAEGLFPLPKPVGGLFITSSNLLLWSDISSSTVPYSIALNQFASLTYSPRVSISQFQSLSLSSLLDCQLLPLTSDGTETIRCLVITKLGEKLVISIARSGRTLGYFNIEKFEKSVGSSPSPSDLVQIDENSIFVASEGGTSQLLSLYGNISTEARNIDMNPTKGKVGNIKKVSSASNVDDIDAYLYGEDVEMGNSEKAVALDEDYLLSLEQEEKTFKSSKSKSTLMHEFKFEVIDFLDSIGPVIDMAVGCPDQNSMELLTVGGSYMSCGDNTTESSFYPGSINILTKKLNPAITASFKLPETVKLWTVNEKNSNMSRYLVASTTSSTLVLKTSHDRIVELEESDFFLEGPTLFCSLLQDSMIIQVFSAGLRLLSLVEANLIFELKFNIGSVAKIVAKDNLIFCLLSDGNLLQFVVENSKIIQTTVVNNQFSSKLSCFTISGTLLFLLSMAGSIRIIDLKDNSLIFVNDLFDRLPIAILNRVNSSASSESESASSVELNQKIIALDTFLSSSSNELMLVCRFESSSSTHIDRSLGMAIYRMSLKEADVTLSRMVCEIIGIIPGGQPVTYESEFILNSNELILYTNLPSIPALTVSTNSRGYPRKHQLLSSDYMLHIAQYNQKYLMILKPDRTVLIVDLKRTRKGYNLDWESDWYLKQIYLPDSTRVPTHIAYHPPSKTYLVASAPIASDFILPADEYSNISDNQNAPEYQGIVPKLFAVESNKLHLLNPVSWTFIDEAAVEFLPFESVTCLRTFELETRQTASGVHPFLTVGTAYQKGEDRPIRGRGMVFDVAEVVPEPGKPESNLKLRLKGITEFKGPVMAFTQLPDAHVLISLGQKVLINTFEDDEKFAGVAFQDTGTCTLALASLKSFFVTADLTNSVAFLAFQAEPLARIYALGRDYGQNLQCTAVEFVINSDGQILIVTSDDQGGLHFFSYAPNNLTTNSGQRLLDKGSFYLHGGSVNKILRIPSKSESKEFCLLTAGQDGSVHAICPVETNYFRRIFVLEMRLSTILPDRGGIATRVARQVPRRLNVSHALPATGQANLILPTCSNNLTSLNGGPGVNMIKSVTKSSSTSGITSTTASMIQNTHNLNSTVIFHHLPVSNSILDIPALRRYHSDSMCDGLARQIFANRFGLDYDTLLLNLAQLDLLSNNFFS